MASISGVTSSDGTFLNIQYSLSQEKFEYIKARIYKSNTIAALVSTAQVSHDVNNPVSGNFSILKSMEEIVNSLGATPGVLLLEIGVIKNGERKTYTTYVLVTKTLDCCLADKMNKIIDCGADPNCDDNLDDAQRLYLFMRSAEFVLNTIPNTSGFSEGALDATAIAKLNDAQAKYDKASELCISC